MLISILIATHNSLPNFKKCIESINSQNFKDYEVIVSDCESVDGTIDFIHNNHIRNLGWYKTEKDFGIYDALNKGIINSRGKWIIVLGSDDTFINEYSLADLSREIEKYNSTFSLIVTDLIIRSKITTRYKKYSLVNKNINKAPILHHQAVIILRDDILNMGMFNLKYHIHADYDLILKIYTKKQAIKIDSAFISYQTGGFSSNVRLVFRSLHELQKIQTCHGYETDVLKFFSILVKGIIVNSVDIIFLNLKRYFDFKN